MNTNDEYLNELESEYDSPIFSNDFIYCINKKGERTESHFKKEWQ